MNSIKWIFEYLKPYKYRYSFGLILVLIVSGMAMLNPMLTGKIVDEVLGEGQTHLLIPILLSMLLILTVKNMITYYYQITFEKVSQNVMFEGRKQCYEKLMSLDFDFYHQTRTGDLMARLTGDTDCIRHFISWVIYTIFSQVTLFVITITYMFSLNIILTTCLMLVTPIIGYLTYQMMKEVGPTFHEIREAFSRLNSVVQGNISANRVVKAFVREAFEIENLIKKI